MKFSGKRSKVTKALGVVLVLMLMCSVLVLSGCTPAGNEYMKLSKEASTLEQYTYDGTIDMKMIMPASVTAELTAEEKAMMNSMKMDFTGYAITKTGEIAMDYTYKMGNNKPMPLQMRMKGQQVLVNATQMIEFMNSVEPDAKQMAAAKEAFKGVEWIDYDMAATLADAFGVTAKLDFTAVTTFANDFMTYLQENAYKEYSPDIFTAKGNGYEAKVSADKFPAFVKEFATYTLTHSDAILSNAKSFVAKTDDAKFTAMGIKKADIVAALGEASTEKPTFTDADKAAFNTTIDEMTKMFAGSEFSDYITKVADKKYKDVVSMNIIFTDPTVPTDKMGITMDITMNIDGTKAVVSSFPTTGIKTLSAVRATAKPIAISGTLYFESGSVHWNRMYDVSLLDTAGTVQVVTKEVDGYNYLPMRQLAELFGQNVEWDHAAAKAYVVQGDKKIEMSGLVENGTTYVKLREFEKIGYTIGYDADMGGIATFTNEAKKPAAPTK